MCWELFVWHLVTDTRGLIVMMTLRIHDTGGEADCFLINDTFMSGMIRMRRKEKAWEGFKLITDEKKERKNMWLSPHLLCVHSLLSAKIFDQECKPSFWAGFEVCPPAISFLFADTVVSHVSLAISLSCQVIIWQRRVPFEASVAGTVRRERGTLQFKMEWNCFAIR